MLIAFGIYVLSSYRVNEVGALAAYSYIGLGVATIVVFLLGIFGAARESVCCTITVSGSECLNLIIFPLSKCHWFIFTCTHGKCIYKFRYIYSLSHSFGL